MEKKAEKDTLLKGYKLLKAARNENPRGKKHEESS